MSPVPSPSAHPLDPPPLPGCQCQLVILPAPPAVSPAAHLGLQGAEERFISQGKRGWGREWGGGGREREEEEERILEPTREC